MKERKGMYLDLSTDLVNVDIIIDAKTLRQEELFRRVADDIKALLDDRVNRLRGVHFQLDQEGKLERVYVLGNTEEQRRTYEAWGRKALIRLMTGSTTAPGVRKGKKSGKSKE